MKKALFSAFLVFCIIICTGCQQQSASSVASETIATEDSISESPVTEAEIESNISSEFENTLSSTLTDNDKANIPIEMSMHNISFPYQIKDGWIYGSYPNAGKFVFGKCRLEEREWTMLDTHEPMEIVFYKEYIYVILLEDNSRPIYRMTLGGNNLQKIVDGTTQYMQIKNDRLYYCLMNAENESNYYSCDMDGTNQCKEIDKNIYYPYTPDGNLFFYQDDADGETIHLFNKNTSEDNVISSNHAYVPIFDGHHTLYYVKTDASALTGDYIGTLVKYDLDSKEETVLYSGVLTGNLSYAENNLYFVNTNDEYRLYSIDTNGNNIRLISDFPNSQEPVCVGDSLIYIVLENRDTNVFKGVYCSNLDGSSCTKLFEW